MLVLYCLYSSQKNEVQHKMRISRETNHCCTYSYPCHNTQVIRVQYVNFPCLNFSCYTHERCRFGRGCVYAHSNGELMEWQQEYLRKGREKLKKELQDKDEVLSMEMTTNILKGPEEDVSVINVILCETNHTLKN